MQDVRSRTVTYKNNTQKAWYKEVGKRRPRYRLKDIEIYIYNTSSVEGCGLNLSGSNQGSGTASCEHTLYI